MKTFEKKGFYTYTVKEVKYRYRKRSIPGILKFVNPDTGAIVSKEIQMYGCPSRSTPKLLKGTKPSYNWKIAAGMSTHSVFILGQSYLGFRIKAVIENLFPEFISYII